ncbi:MAG: hypothetical protein WAO20_03330 [Acidobacteriota bacterium]
MGVGSKNLPVGRQLVDAGPGVISIKVRAVPVDWRDRGEFTALLILSEYPHDVAWMPLADMLYPIELGE